VRGDDGGRMATKISCFPGRGKEGHGGEEREKEEDREREREWEGERVNHG